MLGDFGYQRSRWSMELLAIKINEITGCLLHAGTLRRWLPAVGLVWRRAAPTLRIRDPHKEEKMAALHKALENAVQKTRCFMKMRWTSISTPKSAQTGRYAVSKNAWLPRSEWKILSGIGCYTAVQVKSAT